MGTAEKTATNLHTVTNYPTLAVLANRGDGLDRALEAVESVARASCYQFKTLVVFVATNFTGSHKNSSPGVRRFRWLVSSSIRCVHLLEVASFFCRKARKAFT